MSSKLTDGIIITPLFGEEVKISVEQGGLVVINQTGSDPCWLHLTINREDWNEIKKFIDEKLKEK